EGLKHRVAGIAPDKRVNAAASLLVFALVALPSAADVHLLRNFREDTRATHLPVDAPAHREGRVANLFARQPLAPETPEQLVVRINLGRLDIERRRLLIDVREHNQTAQLLDAPALLDKSGRKPIQQFTVSFAVAHLAEIARRADDAASEVVMPDAVDHHASGQWVG